MALYAAGPVNREHPGPCLHERLRFGPAALTTSQSERKIAVERRTGAPQR